MYPNRDVPVCQLSVDGHATPEEAFAIGKSLRLLREEGVLVLASGNIVHNLMAVDWTLPQDGFGWAVEFDGYMRAHLLAKSWPPVLNYQSAPHAGKAVPHNDHYYYPLLYAIGAVEEMDKVDVYNDKTVLGAVSMTSYVFSPYEKKHLPAKPCIITNVSRK